MRQRNSKIGGRCCLNYQMASAFVLSLMSCSSPGGPAPSDSPLSRANLTGCERFNLIHDSLEKECNPSLVESIMKKRGQPFEEKLTKGKGWDHSIVGFIHGLSTDKTTTCDLNADVENPGKVLVALSSTNFCPEVLAVLNDKVSGRDFALAISEKAAAGNTAMEGYAQAFYRTASRLDEKGDNHDVQKINETTKMVEKRLNADCAKGVPESCAAREAMQTVSDQLNEDKKDAQYATSAEGITEEITAEACKLNAELDRHKKILNFEKRIGKESNVEDLDTVHTQTSWIISIKEKLKELTFTLKKKTKRNLDLKKCTEQ